MKIIKTLTAKVKNVSLSFRVIDNPKNKMIGFLGVSIRDGEYAISTEAPVFGWVNPRSGEHEAGIITSKDDYYAVTRRVEDKTFKLWTPSKELKNALNSWLTKQANALGIGSVPAPAPAPETPAPEELGLTGE